MSSNDQDQGPAAPTSWAQPADAAVSFRVDTAAADTQMDVVAGTSLKLPSFSTDSIPPPPPPTTIDVSMDTTPTTATRMEIDRGRSSRNTNDWMDSAESDGEATAEANKDGGVLPSSVLSKAVFVYQGPILDIDDPVLRKTYVVPLCQALEQFGLNPDELLMDWTLALRRRKTGKLIDADYYAVSLNEHYRSKKSVIRRLTNTASSGDESNDEPKVKRARSTKKKSESPPSLSSFGRKNSSASSHTSDSDSDSDSSENDASPRDGRTINLFKHDRDPPARKRQQVIYEHLRDMMSLVDRLFRIDKYSFFGGLGPPPKTMQQVMPDEVINFHDVRRKASLGGYVIHGREAFVDWEALAVDVERIVDTVCKPKTEAQLGVLDDSGSLRFAQKRVLEVVQSTASAGMESMAAKWDKIHPEEELDWIENSNKEPAMPSWRKTLLAQYAYDVLTEYKPASGLLPEEKDQLISKLTDSSEKGNRWVYAESTGLEMVDLWAPVMALDRSHTKKSSPDLKLALNQFGETPDVMEQPTWGIDCFCRKNIEMVLLRGKWSGGENEPRLTMPQIRWVIETILLRAINAVRPIEQGWDITFALNSIKEKAGVLGCSSEVAAAAAVVTAAARISTSTSTTSSTSTTTTSTSTMVLPRTSKNSTPTPSSEIVLRRIKIFWAEEKEWRSGRVIDYRPHEHNIAYDDGETTWVDLSQKKFQLIDSGEETYDGNVSGNQLLAFCSTLLEYVSSWGASNFCIHSKGNGIITNVNLPVGNLVAVYFGILYPCWLWEEKEAKEDAERLEHKKNTGEIVLPDFWNMRLEVPKGEDDEGIDLLHVDAKTGGNFASRMSHSCRPNCGAMTAVIDGKYCIGMRALCDIEVGEELTIDYNCVTDSMDEFRAAICLCGAHDCRGSFLYTTGAQHQMDIIDRSHTALHRVAMLFSACYEPGELERTFGLPSSKTWPRWSAGLEEMPIADTAGAATAAEQHATAEAAAATASALVSPLENGNTAILQALREKGFGKRALGSLPEWTLRFAAYALEFLECEALESTKIDYTKRLSSNPDMDADECWRIAQFESSGVASQRMTNLVISLDKVRHHMCERLTTNTINDPANPEADIDSERSKLRERWWIADRCLARWVGDDEDEYPDWYAATVNHVYVATGELRVTYDTDEVNRIPMSKARRPTLAEIAPPYTGCAEVFHQPPFRVLDDSEMLFFLWNDQDSGIASRLVKSLIQAVDHGSVSLWQPAYDQKTKSHYWWNFDTRRIVTRKPPGLDSAKKSHLLSKHIATIERMVAVRKPETGEGAKKALRELRDLIIKLPVDPANRKLEDMHQKAVDLLTMYINTRNFFVLSEPETQSGNHHAVINALTSWLGQGMELRVDDVTEMVGAAFLPPIERCYDENCDVTSNYANQVRNTMMSHMRSTTTYLKAWPKEVVAAFPEASSLPPQPADLEKQWPHPVPPVRLFGSPALDSAIFNHLDYTRACALTKESGKKIRDPIVFEENRGSKNMQGVAAHLKQCKREAARYDVDERAKVTPPSFSESTTVRIPTEWVQCDQPRCRKWRVVPPGFDVKKMPVPFYCKHLIDLDPEYANCSVPEEKEDGPVVGGSILTENRTTTTTTRAPVDLDPETLVRGAFVDAYDGSDWHVASVVEMDAQSVLVKYLVGPLLNRQERHLKRKPDNATLASLHAHTPRMEMRRARANIVPYEDLYPGLMDDPDVARLVHTLVERVDRALHPTMQGQAGGASRKTKVGTSGKRVRGDGDDADDNDDFDFTDAEVMFGHFLPMTSSLDTTQKNALANYFECEHSLDPTIPAVQIIARFAAMSASQRQTWEGIRTNNASHIARLPKRGDAIILPLLSNCAVSMTSAVTLDTIDKQDERVTFATLDAESGFVSYGTPLITPFGKGIVIEATSEHICMALEWGNAKLYVPKHNRKISARFPFFPAVSREWAEKGGVGFSRPGTKKIKAAVAAPEEENREDGGVFLPSGADENGGRNTKRGHSLFQADGDAAVLEHDFKRRYTEAPSSAMTMMRARLPIWRKDKWYHILKE